ncbi:MauE/DoxX family redox-associated membrane protein [Flavobacterium sp. FlaQc-57]|uniref:MauE/DoxX family redox-associated membrane protein n=1 Tax=Flavobacterium sp. FlaQc-57 TaxID=3374186 RepID=UPI003757E695
MNSSAKIKNYVVEIICLLYVLLFVYAGVSKILDFENFQVQLGQSPLLSAFAFWVSWLVPLVELIITALLIIPKFRKIGLKASLGLMTMFTAYIFIILHYSSFVPCSCGGILEKMSWNVHLIFNIVFMILAMAAILFSCDSQDKYNNGSAVFKSLKWIAATIVISTSIVIFLFLSSENIMHHNNPFFRRYPTHSAEFSSEVDLKFNSYYFAGFSSGRVYLGNYTNPSHVVALNEDLKEQDTLKIAFDPKAIPFKIVTIAVRNSHFFLFDGSVPIFFRGDLKNWRVTKELKGMPYFTRAIPIDSTTIVFRSNNAVNSANVLGIYNSIDSLKVNYKRGLLQKQIDGIFDTDGTLVYSEELKKIIYVYYYRNEFIVADQNGFLDYRGNTIDTIKQVKIKVTSLKNGTERAMSSPSFVVNAHTAVYKNLLFVHSKVKGRAENDQLWERSFIIDIYDLNNKSYLLSFPIYHRTDEKLHSFIVTQTHLYALIGKRIAVYKFREIIKKEFKSK